MNSNPVPGRSEITLGISRPVLLRLRHIAFYLLLAYAASMTLPLVFNGTATGLDPSWSFATNYFAASDYKYGPDIIFTHGPLGFVDWPENIGWNLPVAFALRLLIWGLLIGETAIAYRGSRSAPFACFLAVLSIIVAQPGLSYLFDEMLASAALLMMVRDHPEAQKFWRLTVWLSILITIAFLAKVTGYLMLMPAFTAYYCLAYWVRRIKPSRAALLRFGWVAALPIVAYFVYNPSVTGLWAYLTGALDIVSGYGAAMSLVRPPGVYLGLEAFVILLLGFAIYGGWRKWLGIEAIGCVLIAFFVVIKHGIVRHAPLFFYGFGLVLFAILMLKCRRVKAAAIVSSATWAVLCVLSLTGMNSLWKTLSIDRWNPVPHLKQIGKVLHWRDSVALVLAQSEEALLADALPDSLLARIQRAPVVVFPWELAYGPANHLNLVPLYTLQSYAAYTNRLDRATAQHLTRAARDTRLLVEWKSIDGRHPLLDVPATWEAINNGFEGELATPGLLLLKKRDRQAAFNFKVVSRIVSDVHQWQNVPDREHAVSVSVSFSRTLLGIARGFFYKINPVYVDLEADHSEPIRFRVVPDVLRYPFVINCLPLDQSGLESLIFGYGCRQKVKRFRFSGEGLDSFSSSTEVSFAEAPDARLRFGGEAKELSRSEPSPAPSSSGAPTAKFGDGLSLTGYSIRNKNGHTEVELRWSVLQKVSTDYNAFVHALDGSGAVVFQGDHALKNATGSQTSAWNVGDSVDDRFSMIPPVNRQTGSYTLRIGVWDPKAVKFLKVLQTNLPQPADSWKGRVILIKNVECK